MLLLYLVDEMSAEEEELLGSTSQKGIWLF